MGSDVYQHEWVGLFKRQLEMIVFLNGALFVVINSYARPALNSYMASFGNVYVFIDNKLIGLSQPVTPARVSINLKYGDLKEYVTIYRYLKEKEFNIGTIVSLTPLWDAYNVLGSIYCPEDMPDTERSVCLLRNTPRIVYHVCTGRQPSGDKDDASIIAELLSSTEYIGCANKALSDAVFRVTVDLDQVISYLNDITQGVMNMIHQYYSKISEPIAAYTVGKLLFASRILTSLINKRVGEVYNIPPNELLSELLRVYNTISGVIDSISKALLVRFVT